MRRLSGLVMVATAVAMTGCAQPGHSTASRGPDGIVRTVGCSVPSTPPATQMFGTAQPVNQAALDGIVDRIMPYAMQHFADVYAGIEINSPGNRVRVHRMPSAALDAWIVSTFADVCVEAVDAKHSFAELNALTQRIVADGNYWRSVGVPIYTIATLNDGSAVEVTTGAGYVDEARRQMSLRYGANAPITVKAGDPPAPMRLERAGA